MPDLNTEYHWVCESLLWYQERVGSSSNKGEGYNVTCDKGQWDCTCQGFRFRRTCKHVEAAKKKRCAWSAYVHGGEPVEENGERKCPECGGPVTSQGYGV